jgi:hypothetical protein
VSVAELRRTLALLNEVPEQALTAACKAIETVAAQEGGTVVLGRKRRRVKLKAITRIKGSGNSITATVWGVPTGPWVWKNTGTAGHSIPKRKPTPKRPRPMHGDGYAHPVSNKQIHHPGSSGHGAWRTVVSRAEKIVPDYIGKAIHEAVSRG